MQITHAGDSICTAAAPLQLPERTAVLQTHYKCLLCILHSRKYFYTAECPANIHVYLQGGSLVIAVRLLAYFHETLHSFMGVLWKILLLYWDLDPYSLYNKNVFIGIRRRFWKHKSVWRLCVWAVQWMPANITTEDMSDLRFRYIHNNNKHVFSPCF